MDKEIFGQLGLNERETDIYITLLKEKEINASQIAKITKIHRTTVYLELEHLINKGLASYVIKDSKRYFRAADPQKFIELLEEKKNNFNKILPDLKSLHSLAEGPKIEVFEGKEGVKTFYLDVVNIINTEILSFGSTGYAFEMFKYYFPQIIKTALKNKIKGRYLANHNTHEQFKGYPQLGIEVKYMDEKYFSEVTTIIYRDKVGIQSLKDNNIYITLITDKNLAQTYKNYFEYMWDSHKDNLK